MSDFDNFDMNQISSKQAQKNYIIYNFYSKKISILDSLDNTDNATQYQIDLPKPLPYLVMERNLSCPAVSHNCSTVVLPST